MRIQCYLFYLNQHENIQENKLLTISQTLYYKVFKCMALLPPVRRFPKDVIESIPLTFRFAFKITPITLLLTSVFNLFYKYKSKGSGLGI